MQARLSLQPQHQRKLYCQMRHPLVRCDMLVAHHPIGHIDSIMHVLSRCPKKETCMDFALTSEQKMVQETVHRFVDKELIPLETEALRSEGRYAHAIPDETYHALQMKAK